jgi:hypothetical protein
MNPSHPAAIEATETTDEIAIARGAGQGLHTGAHAVEMTTAMHTRRAGPTEIGSGRTDTLAARGVTVVATAATAQTAVPTVQTVATGRGRGNQIVTSAVGTTDVMTMNDPPALMTVAEVVTERGTKTALEPTVAIDEGARLLLPRSGNRRPT